jgi:hydrogenase expression/formation protein HypD
MDYLAEFSDRQICQGLADQIAKQIPRQPITLMEVCGTHTMAIFQHGLRELLPDNLTLLSGPGCPVCVTPNQHIDHAIAIAQSAHKQVCLTTFGDMLRVPGSSSSLEQARTQGFDVRVVYAALDALAIAEREPRTTVVFLGIGFETTTPTVAASVIDAKRKGQHNYYVIAAHKIMPPAIQAILQSQDVKLDGLLLPGHVSTIIGRQAYDWLAQTYHIPCAIAGFTPVDILQAILALVNQIASGTASVDNCYTRAVQEMGNRAAQQMMAEVFEVCDSEWRGLGVIPQSGLTFRSAYHAFDALAHFDVQIEESRDHRECLCGDILRGARIPSDCPLFGKTCTPQTPVGPCMVSSEGTCAAYYKYQKKRRIDA